MHEIETFADILCPFTHVGLHRLVSERSLRGRSTPRFRVRAWPLELVNGAPLDGEAVADKAAALRRSVAPDLFAGLDSAHFPTTSRPALALAAAAYRRDAATGEAVSIALRDAVFESGLDVADPAVLDVIARAHDVGPVLATDIESIEADWRDGVARGVIGSPHFFFDGVDSFCPTLRISHVGDELDIELDEPAFAAFTERIFGSAEPYVPAGARLR